jgi:hypothetical protein
MRLVSIVAAAALALAFSTGCSANHATPNAFESSSGLGRVAVPISSQMMGIQTNNCD